MATVTITTTTAEDVRVAAAFGAYVGLANGQSATASQVKQAIIAWIVSVVQNYEYNQSVDAVQKPTPIAPT